MPIPFTTTLPTPTWPLPGVLVLVLLGMAVLTTLGIRDLVQGLRGHRNRTTGRDHPDRRP